VVRSANLSTNTLTSQLVTRCGDGRSSFSDIQPSACPFATIGLCGPASGRVAVGADGEGRRLMA